MRPPDRVDRHEPSRWVNRRLHWTVCRPNGDHVHYAFDPDTGVTHVFFSPTSFAVLKPGRAGP
jgi:hypothetical protein